MTDLEKTTRLGLEEFARSTNRRHFLTRTMRAGFAVLASVTFGSIATAQRVYADSSCSCTLPAQTVCSGCLTGSFGGCPTNCSECSSTDGCGSPCAHLTGHWSSCGCGTCGAGCRECWDCECPDCGHLCGCVSACNCCSCCSPADMAAELRRLAAEAGNARAVPTGLRR